MKRLRALIRRVAGLFSGAERERELADEIESHLQMNIDDNLRAGMTPKEARRQAMLRLGGVEKTKQRYRERGTLLPVEDVLGDLRFALRQLAKHPGFAVTAIVVLALGIGVSVAIFGLWTRLCWSRFRMQVPAA
jgi:macrolide transport system ATP-binding/permease protein